MGCVVRRPANVGDTTDVCVSMTSDGHFFRLAYYGMEVYVEDWRGAPDLENPDVLAAFDRRLCLKLCPKAFWVAEQFSVSVRNGVITLQCGQIPANEYIDDPWRWSDFFQFETAEDPLEVRVLLWRALNENSDG